MSDIIVTFKDGHTRKFEDRGAAGGSYCNEIEYQPGFVIITDPHGNKTSIPSEEIEEIYQPSNRRF